MLAYDHKLRNLSTAYFVSNTKKTIVVISYTAHAQMMQRNNIEKEMTAVSGTIYPTTTVDAYYLTMYGYSLGYNRLNTIIYII